MRLPLLLHQAMRRAVRLPGARGRNLLGEVPHSPGFATGVNSQLTEAMKRTWVQVFALL